MDAPEEQIKRLEDQLKRQTEATRHYAAKVLEERARLQRKDETNKLLTDELRRAKGYEADVRGLVGENDLLVSQLRLSETRAEDLRAALKQIATTPMLYSKEAKAMREIAARALVKKHAPGQSVD